jgi:GNAT superfamily N-acetyltransferase
MTPRTDNIRVHPATEAQANVFAECWNDLGWECASSYPGTLARALGDGFLVISVDGHLAGCIVAVLNEGDSPAFVGEWFRCRRASSRADWLRATGYYAVLPEFRAQGYGKHLWNAAIGWIKAELSKQARPIVIALDSVAETIPLYRSQGFAMSNHAVTIWKRPPGLPHVSKQSRDCLQIQDVTQKLYRNVIAYDKRCSGIERGSLLTTLLQTPCWKGWSLRDASEGVSGFIAVRPSVSGFDIGPLHAQSPEAAWQLLSHVIQTLSPDQVYRAEVWSSTQTQSRSSIQQAS